MRKAIPGQVEEDSMNLIALIPARGGSQRLPRKNILPLNGQPLIYWICKTVQESNIPIGYVSTEDAEIKAIVDGFKFTKIKTIDRDPATATDTASAISVIDDFSGRVDWSALVLLQAPCPLLKPEHINGALASWSVSKYHSIVSVVRQQRFLWDREGDPKYDIRNRPRTQDYPGVLVECGAMYMVGRKAYDQFHNFLGGNIGMYELPDYMYTEIDTEQDFKIVEALMA